jgi:hypothetical protein
VPNSTKPPVLPLQATDITFKTIQSVESVKLLGNNAKINYKENNGVITIHLPANIRSINGDVLDLKLK